MTIPKPDLVALAERCAKAAMPDQNGLHGPLSNLLREAAQALRHLASQPSLYEAGREEGARYRHKKRGGIYTVIGRAQVQADDPLSDYEIVTVYRGQDGELWVRRKSEFEDGRFEMLPADGGEVDYDTNDPMGVEKDIHSSDGGVEESPASIPDYNGVKSPALVTAHGLSGKSCPLSRVAPGPSETIPYGAMNDDPSAPGYIATPSTAGSVREAFGWLLDAISQEVELSDTTPLLTRRIEAAAAALSAPVEAPVAWRDPLNMDPGQSVTFDRSVMERWPHIYKQPLYATPRPLPSVEREALEELLRCANAIVGADASDPDAAEAFQMFADARIKARRALAKGGSAHGR